MKCSGPKWHRLMVIFKLADHGQWFSFITEGKHGRTVLNVITVAHYVSNSCIVIKLARNAFCLCRRSGWL